MSKFYVTCVSLHWIGKRLLTYLIVLGSAKVGLPIISFIGCCDHLINTVLVAFMEKLMVAFFLCFSTFYGCKFADDIGILQ